MSWSSHHESLHAVVHRIKHVDSAVAIEDDPFVRDLVRDLGAEVVSSSIRPADDPAGSNNAKR